MTSNTEHGFLNRFSYRREPDLRLQEAVLHLPNDPVQRSPREAQVLEHPLGGQGRAEQAFEEERGIELRLLAEGILPGHHQQALLQI